MNSINTNFAAMTALQTLNSTNKSMLDTQNRISTGMRVSSAQDNAAYWSMATTMRSDNMSLSTVSDALGLGAATVDVAYTAMNSSIDVAKQMKAKLVAAREPGVDRSKVQTEINALQDQMRSIAGSASFTGENWLSVDTGAASYSTSKSVVSSFSRTGDQVSVGTISISISSSFLFNANTDGAGGAGTATAIQLGILGSERMTGAEATAASGTRGAIGAAAGDGSIILASADGTGEMDITSATDTQIDDYIQAMDSAIGEMTTAATNFGSAKSRIGMQKDFVSNLRAAIDRGISSLVDADMNEESTKLQALQVQQQLGVQALSIANSSSQSILSLFRG